VELAGRASELVFDVIEVLKRLQVLSLGKNGKNEVL
jgi:hypothetical protein